MAIEQIAQPCWYARYKGGEDYANLIHYDSEAEAQEIAGEIRDDDGQTAVETGQLPASCWTAQCAGPDGAHPLEDLEYGWTLHLDSCAEAEAACREAEWIVTKDGEVFCPQEAPECDRADLVVTGQVPGQFTLTGEGGGDV